MIPGTVLMNNEMDDFSSSQANGAIAEDDRANKRPLTYPLMTKPYLV